MGYQKIPYPQQYGEFTPYVTGLDLVANCGLDGRNIIKSLAIKWVDFVHG